jgi:hypothetical protein
MSWGDVVLGAITEVSPHGAGPVIDRGWRDDPKALTVRCRAALETSRADARDPLIRTGRLRREKAGDIGGWRWLSRLRRCDDDGASQIGVEIRLSAADGYRKPSAWRHADMRYGVRMCYDSMGRRGRKPMTIEEFLE